MNKTLSIGLAGFSFTIEEHAYIKLSDYLDALRSSLDREEADEVMHDIEIRMVEIFKDSLGKREVINDGDVERVIAQIGTPEKIEEQEEAYYSEKNTKRNNTYSSSQTDKKQLFRDPERQKIAGVCAGLAHYVGMDITAMRAIWAIVFLILIPAAASAWVIVLLYIILWIVLPKAESAADFLKMKGKPMNFDNLKNESNKLVQFANESTQRVGEIYVENKPYINNAGSGIWNVLKYIIGAFFALMAVGSIVGIFFIIGLFGMNTDFEGANQIRFYFEENGMDKVITALMIIGSLIPALIFTVLSIKIFSPKTKLRNTGWVLGALFLALIALGSYFGLNMAKQDMLVKGHKDDAEEVMIPTQSDSIYVDVKKVAIPQNFTAYDDDLFSDKQYVFKKDWIDVEVNRKANIKSPYLIIKKNAKGYNIPLNINVPVEIVNNKVILPNYIKYPYEQRFRDFRVSYELVVPKNTVVLSMNKDAMNIDDDNNREDNNSNDKVIINGTSIEYDSDNKDSIIINGKKYPKSATNSVIDSMKSSLKKAENVDIKIKNGDKEVSIQTK